MSASPSIGFINNFGGASLGGGEVQLLTLMRGLTESGMRVSLVCPAGSALSREASGLASVRVEDVSFNTRSIFGLARATARALAGVDLVQGTGFLTNLIARQVGHRLRVPIVNTVHVMPDAPRVSGESRLVGAVRTALDRASRRRVDRFVAVSQAVADALVADGVDAQRIVVIANGIDLEAFRASARAHSEAGLSPAARRVGYIGRLEAVKGCREFVAAAALVGEAIGDVRFVLAGTGSLESEMRQSVEKSPVSDRFDMMGYVEHVAPLIAALDVVCVPSLSEAFGLTAVEASALGVPVVASRVGGLPGAVLDGVTGLLVAPGSPTELADAVVRLLKDVGYASGLGAAGTTRVEELFTAESMIGGYQAIYHELVS